MRIDQLGLLLWKNYIVRKRQPVSSRLNTSKHLLHIYSTDSCKSHKFLSGNFSLDISLAGSSFYASLYGA